MLRPFSTNAAQNPGGWQGADWSGLGWNVYAYFPEFPPDGNPVGDPIGSAGSVGSPEFDLQVDYQATSADFWRIVETHAPTILITTSRGGDIGWELEAVEGGHQTWISDRYGDEHLPTEATVDPRSWQALKSHTDQRLLSQLPINKLYRMLKDDSPVSVAIDWETSGNYLSGFMGLHGLYYNATHGHNLAAGHIHVGRAVAVADAQVMLERTLKQILTHHQPPRCKAR